MVINVDDESAFIMSLTENIARRKFSPLELLSGIEQLRDQGYDKKLIAQKTGLSPEYVQGILQLLQNGEQRLLMAVGSGRILSTRRSPSLARAATRKPFKPHCKMPTKPESCVAAS